MKKTMDSFLKRLQKAFATLFAIFLVSAMMISCGVKDSDLQSAIDQKIQATPEMTGVSAAVQDGVVTLSGECKDDACKLFTENTVKGMKGVKSVVNNTTVAPPPPAPVTIAADDALVKGVADATKDFKDVKATVNDGVITLTGEIKRSDLKTLMQSLNTLKPKKIDNQLVIK
ncbi:MAG TPA: BON domain-containing protein [Parafilimonas sp.]|nr:BON domain-containing protein [Parafilimonas sp.]